MYWFRLYNEVRHDPKVQNLRPELFKFWINLLCLASAQPQRGTIPDVDTITTDLGMRRDHVERFISSLEASKLLIRGSLGELKPNQWDARQPHSDNVTERVRRHRERRSVEPLPPYVTLPNPGCNVTCYVADSDRDKENTIPPLPPIGAKPVVVESLRSENPSGDRDRLDAVGLATLGQRYEMEHVDSKVKGWRASYSAADIEAAFQIAGSNLDAIPSGNLGRYIHGTLLKRHEAAVPENPDMKEVHRCTPERAAQIEASYRPKKQRDYRR